MAWGGSMFVVGTGVALIAIATPYRYGAWLDPGAALAVGGLTLNYGTGLLTALMHVAKAIFVAAIVPAWRRSACAAVICAVVCIPLVLLSTWNAVALLALQRSERVADQRAAIERADNMRAELKSIDARLALVGWTPLAKVEAEIAAEKHHWMWAATLGCTKVTGATKRSYCARQARLEGERGTAIEAERLRAREAEVRREIASQPVASESRQPDLVMLAEWLGITLSTAEVFRTLLWAAVVEIVEIAAFGFAGFFWSAPAAGVAVTTAAHERVGAKPVEDAGQPRSRATAQCSSWHRETKKSIGANPGRRERDGLRAETERCSAAREVDERRRAVEAFVATLRRGPDLRVAGGDLKSAYDRIRDHRSWPKIPDNVFGQLAHAAVEAVGGHKLKASCQFYCGICLPPLH
jgi:hypothetical protein